MAKMSGKTEKGTVARRKPVKLETLEQRILLSGDLPLDGVAPDPSTQGVVSTTPQAANAPSPSDNALLPSRDTLQRQSSSGTLQEVDGASTEALTIASRETLLGNGSLSGALINAGTVAPGHSPGLLNVGSYTQGAAATLRLEIGGSHAATALDGYDQLAVAGGADLGGGLEIDFIDDFRPTTGQVFDVMTWGQRTGSFSSFKGLYAGQGLYLLPVYQPDGLQLVATQLPGLVDFAVAQTAEALAKVDQLFTWLADPQGQGSVDLEATVDVPGLHLSGNWTVGVARQNGVATLSFGVTDGAASWAAGDLTGGLTGLSGSLTLREQNWAMNLAGTGSVQLGDGTALSGEFAIAGSDADPLLTVAASHVAARLGEASTGASVTLSEGELLLVTDGEAYAVNASGTGQLQGFGAARFSGNLAYTANTLDRAIDQAVNLGGVSGRLLFATGEAVSRFQAEAAILEVTGLGEMRGDFAFSSRNRVEGNDRVSDLLVGARGLSAQLTLGELALDLSNGAAALALTCRVPLDGSAGSRSVALQAVADCTVAFDSAVTLSGEQVSLHYNSDSRAVSALVATTGEALPLELGADALRVAGRFTVDVSGVGSFSGDLVVDAGQSVRTLSDGKAVNVRQLALSGSNCLVRVTAGGSGLDAVLSGTDLALVYAKEIDGARSWVTSKAVPGALTLAGYRLEEIESAALSLNRQVEGLDATVLSWAENKSFALSSGRQLLLDQLGETLVLPVQGAIRLGQNSLSGDLTLALEREGGAWGWNISAREAQVLLAAGPAFLRLNNGSGSLRLKGDRTRTGSLSGDFEAGGLAGLTVSGTATAAFDATGELTLSGQATLSLGSFGTLSASIGVSRSETDQGARVAVVASGVSGEFGASGASIHLSGATLGLVLAKDALGQGNYALKATGSAALQGFDGVTLSANARVAVNHLGYAIDQTLNVGGAPYRLLFADESAVQAVQITQGTLTLDGVGSLSGDLAILADHRVENGVEVTDLAIGLEAVSANLSLGAAGAALSDARGAVLLRRDDGGAHYALQLTGDAALTGLSGLTLTAEEMEVAINRMGRAISQEVATSEGWAGVDLLADETRLRGLAKAEIAGLLAVEGELFIESVQNRSVTLTDETTLAVDELILGGSNLSASILAGGESLAASLTGVDIALVLASERNGVRRWLSSEAALGGASIAGYALSGLTAARLDINRAIAAADSLSDDMLDTASTAVIDWSRNNQSIALSTVKNVVLDAMGPRFVVPVSGAITLGEASLSGDFAVILNRAEDGSRSWQIEASGVNVAFAAGEARVGIENGAGSLFIGPDQARSGSISGAGSLTGIDALTLSGTLAASFDGAGGLSVAGELELGVEGFGALSGQFSVVREPARLAVPVERLNQAEAGLEGLIEETTSGGVAIRTVITLTVADAAGRAREGIYTFQYDGETVAATSLDAAGRPLSDEAFAANLREALETITAFGDGNVAVSGSRSEGFRIEWTGAKAGQPVLLAAQQGAAGLWLIEPADPADKPDWGVITETNPVSLPVNESQRLTLQNSGGVNQSFTLALGNLTTAAIPVLSTSSFVNERQVLTVVGDPNLSGQIWLKMGEETTSKVRFGTGPTIIRNGLQSALENLLGEGNVSVSYRKGFTGHNSIDYVIDFSGDLAGVDLEPLQVLSNNPAIRFQWKTLRNGSPGYGVEDQAARIQSALETTLGVGNVAVSWETSSTLANARYRIDFARGLGGENLSQLVAATGSAGLTLATATLQEGSRARGAVQQIDLYDEEVSGTFVLTVDYQGRSYTSGDIAFNARPEVVRQALLGAKNSDGSLFSSTGADAEVVLLADGNGRHLWEVRFGGTASAYDFNVMSGRITSTVTAPEASLALTRQGSFQSETLHLAPVGSGLFRLSVGAGGAQSGLLSADSTAAEIQAALEALEAVGVGNVAVVAADGGGFDLQFRNARGGTAIPDMHLSPVQSLSLLLEDGSAPGSVALRFAGSEDWGPAVDVTGKTPQEVAAYLEDLISLLPGVGIGQGNVSVALHQGEEWLFDITFKNQLDGAGMELLQALSERIDTVASERIRIGAAQVSASLGGGSAGISLEEGTLGLILQKNAAGETRYALTASGTATLQGFEGAVSLAADAAVRINTLDEAVSCEVVTGLSSDPILVDFQDGLQRMEVDIDSGTLAVAELGEISGSLKLVTTSRLENGTTITDVAIGLDGVSGSLTLGGLAASLSNGQGGLVLKSEVTAAGVATQRYALQAEGDVALDGVPGLTLTASDLAIACNRWGEAFEGTVATNPGDYHLDLLKDETRLRGEVHAAIGDVLTLDGLLTIESVANQLITLSDGSTGRADQILIGGSGVVGSLTAAGSDLGVTLADIDIGLVLSNERVAQGAARRWLTGNASIAKAAVAGYELSDLQEARLEINRTLDAASGALAAASDAVIDWSRSGRTISLSEAESLALSLAGPRLAIPVSGSLQLGPARLAGDFEIVLEEVDGARNWTINASDATLGLEAGDAYVGIEEAEGSLVLGADNSRSGSLSGNALIRGLGDLSLSGTFTTLFDVNGDIAFSGNDVTLSVAGFGSLSGNFAVSRGADQSILLGATDLSAHFGAGGVGVSLANGRLGAYIASPMEGHGGYALVASGLASLDGFSGISLSADAAVRINTLGFPVSQTVSVGGQDLSIVFADRALVQEVSILSGELQVAGLGSLSGALAIRSQSADDQTDVQIGLEGVSGTLGLGGMGAALSNGRGAVLLHRDASGSGYAVQAEGSVSLTGVDALTLSADTLQIAYNRMGEAITGQVVETSAGSYTVNLLDEETRLRGEVTAAIAGLLSVEGEMFIETVANQAASLSDGGSVALDQLVLGGSGLSAVLGSGTVAAALADIDIAMVLSTEIVGSGTARRWLTSKARINEASINGYSLADLENADLDINRLLDGNALSEAGAVLNWSGQQARDIVLAEGESFLLDQAGEHLALSIEGALDMGPARLGGAFDIELKQENGERQWEIVASGVTVGVASGTVQVGLEEGAGTLVLGANQARSGSISGRALVSGLPGLSLDGTFLTSFDADGGLALSGQAELGIDGFGAVSGQFSVVKEAGDAGRILLGASDVSALLGGTSAGVALSDARLGLVLDRDIAGENAYALEASGTAVLQGMSGEVSLSAQASLRINTLGETLTQVVETGLNSPALTLNFTDGSALKEVTIQQGDLTVAGLGTLSASLKLTTSTSNENGVEITDLAIGLDAVSGTLGLGGVGAALTGGQGAIVLRREVSADQVVSQRYALAASGDIALTGITGVSLQANDLQIAWNRWGSDLQTSVEGADATFELDLVDNETRLRGQMHAEVAGALELDGELFLESRENQTITLADQTPVQVDQLILGGAGLSALLGNDTVGASLEETDIAMVLSREVGGDSRQWLTAKASLGGATVQGYALADIDSATLQINRILGAGGDAFGGVGSVIDWSGAAREIQLNADKAVILDDAGPLFQVAVDGALQVGLAKLGGSFDILLEQDGAARNWHVQASDVVVALEANGARIAIDNGAGQLFFGADGERSGSLSGDGSVTGVDGLSLNGTLVTRFDNSGNLELAGAVQVEVAGFASISGEFALSKKAPEVIVADIISRAAEAGNSGSVAESQRGGVKSTTLMTLSAISDDGLRFREGIYTFAYGATSVNVSSLSADGLQPLADNAFAFRLQNGLQLLFGSGNVTVSGSRATGFTIEFVGALAGQAISGLTMTPPADPAEAADWGSAYVEKQATAGYGAVHRLDAFDALAQGSYSLEFDFQIKSNTRVKLTASDADGNFREGSYAFSYGGRTAGASTVTANLTPVSDSEFRLRLSKALEILLGSGNVSVSGSRSAGYTVEFVGALAGQEIPLAASAGGIGLFMSPPADPSATLARSGGVAVESQATQATPSTTYILLIERPEGASRNLNNFTFSFANSAKTATAKFVDIQFSQPRHIREALEKIVGAGNVSVAELSSPMAAQEYRITFKESVLSLGLLSVANAGLPEVTYTLGAVLADGSFSEATGAVHRLNGFPAETRGSFTLSVKYGGHTYTTAAVDLHASAATVQNALQNATRSTGASLAAAGVTIDCQLDEELGQWRVEFGGAALGVSIPAMSRTVTPSLAPTARLTTVASGATVGAGTYTTAAIDFQTTANGIRDALLAATTAEGTTFEASGATVSVALDAAVEQWRVSFGGSAVGQAIPAMTRLVFPKAAPTATLATSREGSTTSEVQHLTLDAASGLFALAFGQETTRPLEADGLTAHGLQTALEELESIGEGNVVVVPADGGVWEVRFQGALAGRNLASLQVWAVQSLDVNMADGAIADELHLRRSDAADWQQNLTLTGLSAGESLAALQNALAALPGFAGVTVIAADNGLYHLLGASLPA
ncbi:MAG: LEPR-XLL domain-containing protein, partial [Magnetococcales bacterium]|nr:LEPR-XLL domain-containing protein [Magnetococcales bacterium]